MCMQRAVSIRASTTFLVKNFMTAVKRIVHALRVVYSAQTSSVPQISVWTYWTPAVWSGKHTLLTSSLHHHTAAQNRYLYIFHKVSRHSKIKFSR